MQYRSLGDTGLKVSRLCLGANNFGGQVDEVTAKKILHRAIDLGINTIDTANVYTGGKSESAIGNSLRGDRERVILVTKVGASLGAGKESGLTRKHILSQVSESLKRLQTDYIDIYYMHVYDPLLPLDESLSALNELVREGNVRHVACSNFSLEQVKAARQICEQRGFEDVVAVQPAYNLVNRRVENELLPYCAESGLGVFTYSPLMGGFLTGKYAAGSQPPTKSRGAHNKAFWDRTNNNENFTFLGKFLEISRNASIPLESLAILWILKNQSVTAPIVGASSPEQVEQNCELLDLRVPEDVMKRLDEAPHLST